VISGGSAQAVTARLLEPELRLDECRRLAGCRRNHAPGELTIIFRVRPEQFPKHQHVVIDPIAIGTGGVIDRSGTFGDAGAGGERMPVLVKFARYLKGKSGRFAWRTLGHTRPLAQIVPTASGDL